MSHAQQLVSSTVSADKCRAVRLTPAGRGAIGSIRVDGPSARAIVGELLASSRAREPVSLAAGEVRVARWNHGGAAGEEVVVHARSVDAVEIHCHGGTASSPRYSPARCGDAGASSRIGSTWSQRQPLTPTRAEAWRLAGQRPDRADGTLPARSVSRRLGSRRPGTREKLVRHVDPKRTHCTASIHYWPRLRSAGTSSIPGKSSWAGRPMSGRAASSTACLDSIAHWSTTARVRRATYYTVKLRLMAAPSSSWTRPAGANPPGPANGRASRLGRTEWVEADLRLLVIDVTDSGRSRRPDPPADLVVGNKADLR